MSMTVKPLVLGAMVVGVVAAIAGCGSSYTPTPSSTPSGGLTIPSLPGLGTGTSGAGANTLLNVTDVQSISGDPNVAAVSGTCSAQTCVYADTTSAGGGGGVVVVEQIPGGLSGIALQAALSAALSNGGASANGGTVSAVSGLGSAALKEIEANSATYAFSKDNYFVVINVSSSTISGAVMDGQVLAAAQTAAGKL
jgi:hypothetical protein